MKNLCGNSWMAIQELALNSTRIEKADNTKDIHVPRTRNSAHNHVNRRIPSFGWSASVPPETRVGVGSTCEGKSIDRAAKRKEMLSANCYIHTDDFGRVKRKDSIDHGCSSAPPCNHDERDILVYVHEVRPQDTLSGISIKYNCDQAVLRKANRMWPNDTVQSRRKLVLPVDTCGLKGRLVSAPLNSTGINVDHTIIQTSLPNVCNISPCSPSNDNEVDFTFKSRADQVSKDGERLWKHDSWVILPNNTTSTEIVRVPRRALGYFPSARRKSFTLSEMTPSPSVDLNRSSSSLCQSPDHILYESTPLLKSPSRISMVKSSLLGGKSGGVGTMDSNVHSPGPAQDGLNKLVSSHLPGLVPLASEASFPAAIPGTFDAETEIVPSESESGIGIARGIDIESLPGAVEGWMRKIAARATAAVTDHGDRNRRIRDGLMFGVPIETTNRGTGDLIELSDSFEFEDGDDSNGYRTKNNSAVSESTAFAAVSSEKYDLSERGKHRRRKRRNES